MASQTLPVLALPDDAEKPFEANSDSGDAEVFLNEGLVIYRGPASDPTWVRQGSLLITGTEIRIKRVDGVVQTATAIGTPARFQQQPALDQEIMHVSGNTIHFDNAAQTLTIDEAAEFSQGDSNMKAHHIDYDLKTRHLNATRGPGEPVRSILQATPRTP
ncbi:MAG: lipopolysaccharide transport periplasmic protein LptA [Pseudomonadota bacterium]